MATVDAADERPHPPGPELHWAESWTFDFIAPGAALGGWARITSFPNQRVGWYHAFLCGPERDVVAVIDHDVPVPDRSLEIRTTGLWATHICETPMDHWTVGLEAFGIEVDEPAELYGRQHGVRVPLGFDLEWEAEEMPEARCDGATGYHQASRVTGEILVDTEVIVFDGFGRREHAWGRRADWDERWFRAHGRLEDGATFAVSLVGGDIGQATGSLDGRTAAVDAVHQRMVAPAMPGHAAVRVDGLALDLHPVAVTPLEVLDPEARRTRAPRALCRVSAEDGRTGAAWAEWNEPQT